mmetsp:Transcript_34871/g.76081  ORF Transcript_34871/g.76081 Transcript_34871/m.76081 type:complete len:428 (-) Transcript_34871:152-1435(-)
MGAATGEQQRVQALRESMLEKRGEAAALEEALQHVVLDSKQLRLRLQAHGVRDASVIPVQLRCGGTQRNADFQTAEHRSLLEWLAATCDTSVHTIFSTAGGVQIGDREALLGRMVQWRLSEHGGLRLNVPEELASDFVSLLSRTRRGLLGPAELRQLTDDWELLGAEVSSEGDAQPAIFLVHRKMSHAVVVAAWPDLKPRSASGAPLDPESFFSAATKVATKVAHSQQITFADEDGDVSTLAVRDGTLQWSIAGRGSRVVRELAINFNAADRCTLSGPFGAAAMAEPGAGVLQRELVRHLLMLALACDVPVRGLGATGQSADTLSDNTSWSAFWVDRASRQEGNQAVAVETKQAGHTQQVLGIVLGDHVEVEFEGEWFSGVLQGVEGDIAHVKCDVDEPMVITLAPLSNIRPAPRHQQRHMRSKSYG